MSEFSIRVKELRSRLGISKKEMALRVGVSDSTITRWERGISKPASTETIENLIHIANGLR